MIHVDPKPEPDDFDEKVRVPGHLFLSQTPIPRGADWKRHAYWSRCSDQLYTIYKGICAYTGEWISKISSSPSVDHFYPKSTHQELAYEWDNYRLTTPKINSYKGDKIVSDPFKVQNGDFTIDFPSCQIKPRASMTPAEKSKVLCTIEVLHLNEEDMITNRLAIIGDYINGYFTNEYLEKQYPFIASELSRQNLYDTVGERFKSLR